MRKRRYMVEARVNGHWDRLRALGWEDPQFARHAGSKFFPPNTVLRVFDTLLGEQVGEEWVR